MSNLPAIIEQHMPAIEKSITSIDKLKFLTAARNIALDTNLAKCTPDSLKDALIFCAVKGLMPGSHYQQVYILPEYDKKAGGQVAKPMIDYRGFIVLANRAGIVDDIQAGWYRDMDEIENGFIANKPAFNFRQNIKELDNPENKLCGVWVQIRLKNGNDRFTIHSKTYIDKCMKKSKFPEHAWKQWYESMGIKPCIKSALKLIPIDLIDDNPHKQEFLDAVSYDDSGFNDFSINPEEQEAIDELKKQVKFFAVDIYKEAWQEVKNNVDTNTVDGWQSLHDKCIEIAENRNKESEAK